MTYEHGIYSMDGRTQLHFRSSTTCPCERRTEAPCGAAPRYWLVAPFRVSEEVDYISAMMKRVESSLLI
jgi:hypothetical protein